MLEKVREILSDKQNFVINELVSVIDTYGDGILQFLSRKILKAGANGIKYLSNIKIVFIA